MRKKPLTPNQAEVLDAVVELSKRNGIMPTSQEIADFLKFGRAGRERAYSYIRQLQKKGHLKRTEPAFARNIKLA